MASIVDGFLNGVLHTADRVLNFTGGLVCLAFALELGIPGYLSGNLFYFAFDLLGAALNAIFIHRVLIVGSVGGR